MDEWREKEIGEGGKRGQGIKWTREAEEMMKGLWNVGEEKVGTNKGYGYQETRKDESYQGKGKKEGYKGMSKGTGSMI